ncbi:MAG: FAD-dependent oxidoreductase, partial [Parcubacteria group bacterium]|nr:FAD-dependent oxidoreductase [Parcubacteria group bacterium]
MFLNSTKPTIVIAGAGFGGLRAALDLSRAFKKNPRLAQKYNLYLIDQNDHHLFTPSVYEMAVTMFDDGDALELKNAVTLPLYQIFKNGPLKFHQARVTKIDPIEKILNLNDSTKLKFDYLVIALGAETNFYNIPGLKEKALTLGNLNSAVRIRNEIEKKFCAALPGNKPINIVFGGGGVTGVELAGEMRGYIKKLNKKYDSKTKPRLTIIEGQKDILPGFDERMVSWAKKRLGKLGINTVTGDLIEEIRFESTLTKSGGRFNFDVLIWSGGIKPNHLVDNLPFKKDPRGRVMIQRNFCPVFEASGIKNAGGCSNVLVIGDNCCLMEHGEALPQTAQMAIDEGRQAAKIILSKIQNKPPPLYQPLPNRYILPLG